MPLLSDHARKKKINYFMHRVAKDALVLEIGSGEGWLGRYLRENGWKNYTGIDIRPGNGIVGDVRDWKNLGLAPASFDVIVAFEVVEHVNIFKECYDLLKPGGQLFATSPVPRLDWVLKFFEFVGLNQKRTSPHDHLIEFEMVPYFEQRHTRIVAGLAQWGVFTKTGF